jgi:hypothetical protein
MCFGYIVTVTEALENCIGYIVTVTKTEFFYRIRRYRY